MVHVQGYFEHGCLGSAGIRRLVFARDWHASVDKFMRQCSIASLRRDDQLTRLHASKSERRGTKQLSQYGLSCDRRAVAFCPFVPITVPANVPGKPSPARRTPLRRRPRLVESPMRRFRIGDDSTTQDSRCVDSLQLILLVELRDGNVQSMNVMKHPIVAYLPAPAPLARRITRVNRQRLNRLSSCRVHHQSRSAE